RLNRPGLRIVYLKSRITVKAERSVRQRPGKERAFGVQPRKELPDARPLPLALRGAPCRPGNRARVCNVVKQSTDSFQTRPSCSGLAVAGKVPEDGEQTLSIFLGSRRTNSIDSPQGIQVAGTVPDHVRQLSIREDRINRNAFSIGPFLAFDPQPTEN